jgi:uncharacterized membrane protein YuzA (DUF378 family)
MKKALNLLTVIHMTFSFTLIFIVVKRIVSIVKEAGRITERSKGLKMKKLDVLAAVLVVVGAVNWGLVAVAHFDLVAAIFGMRFGEVSPLSAVIYGLVALSGLYQALGWKAIQRRWHGEPAVQHSH